MKKSTLISRNFSPQGDVLVATSSWVASASAKNPSLEQHPAEALSSKINNMVNMNDDDGEISSRLKNVVHFYMMDIKEVDNATFNLSGDPGCLTRWDYSRYSFKYKSIFGLTFELFQVFGNILSKKKFFLNISVYTSLC